VDGAVELVGVNTLQDTLDAVRPGGTVCFTGMLSDQWTIPEFYPMDWLPNGVRLTAYSGEAADLTPAILQDFSTPSPLARPASRSAGRTAWTRSSKPITTWKPALSAARVSG
jgi:hypothetical protein